MEEKGQDPDKTMKAIFVAGRAIQTKITKSIVKIRIA